MASRTYETRELLADTRGYARHMAAGTMRSHVVEITSAGQEARVLCGRIKLDSLADAGAAPVDAPATCERCARRDPRRPPAAAAAPAPSSPSPSPSPSPQE